MYYRDLETDKHEKSEHDKRQKALAKSRLEKVAAKKKQRK